MDVDDEKCLASPEAGDGKKIRHLLRPSVARKHSSPESRDVAFMCGRGSWAKCLDTVSFYEARSRETSAKQQQQLDEEGDNDDYDDDEGLFIVNGVRSNFARDAIPDGSSL